VASREWQQSRKYGKDVSIGLNYNFTFENKILAKSPAIGGNKRVVVKRIRANFQPNIPNSK